MKTLRQFCGILLPILFCTFISSGQSGTFTTIAGNGTSAYPNASGPATASAIGELTPGGGFLKIATDYSGNIFFGRYGSHVISKIKPDGSISHVLGDGQENYTFDSLTGGPSSLGHVSWLMSMACDRAGNLYFADLDNYSLFHKVDTFGVVTDFGSGYGTYFVYVDSFDNVYYGNDATVQKRTPSGITTTIVGNGIPGFSGDGGPATAAQIANPLDMAINSAGYIFIADVDSRIRMITPAGIISTIAGNGTSGITGDGGLAYLASLGSFEKLSLDLSGNLILSGGPYCPRIINTAGIISSLPVFADNDIVVPDGHGNIYCSSPNTLIIQKFTPSATASSGNCNLHITRSCAGSLINISTTLADSTMRSVNYYGDGINDTTAFVPGSFGVGGYASFQHAYGVAGSYTIKNIIINSTGAIDSFSSSYTHQPCGAITIQPYIDNNSNCIFDATDVTASFPMTIAVDSNGFTLDTISIAGGMYYMANGNAGDVYTFRILSHPASVSPTCPTSGVIADTFTIYGDNSRTLNIGFNCSPVIGADVSVQAGHRAGRHSQQLDIAVNNNYCTPTNVTLTVNFSPKYNYSGAYPAPTSIAGHTLTWNFAALSTLSAVPNIHLSLETPATWLLPGDTAHTQIIVTPITGDMDSTNNIIRLIDTVKSSYDPNYIAVSPEGNILNGTKLKYTIEFENDGNDTAQNIYVMDTLSDNVDPSSFEMVMATHHMNIAMFQSSGHNIVKFDFPNIKLLDSTHHNECTGMAMFNINAKSGLPDNTDVFNHAGIFFDDNPVVMTNTIQNVIRMPNITIAETATVCAGDTVMFTAISPNINNTHYRWFANAAAVGSDKPEFISNALLSGDLVNCQLWDGTGDSLLSTSNNLPVTYLPAANAGTITGTPTVCEAATTALNNAVIGGTWASSAAAATVAGGVVTGVTAGRSIISYTVTNSCGTATDTMEVTVNPLPHAGSITGMPSVCEAATTTLTNSITGGTWSSSATSATVAGGVVSGITAGNTIISYSVTNSCGTAVDTMLVTVNPLPYAGTITGIPIVCETATTTLANTATGGTWSSNAASATVTGGVVSGITAGSSIIAYAVTNSCGTATDTMEVTINPLPNAGTITGMPSVCEAATTALTNSITGGTWSSSAATATVTGGIITGSSPGSTIISYSITNSCGTAVDTMMVVVNPLPNAGTITGTPIVCELGTTTLSNTATGGTWASSSSNVTIASGLVTAISAGTSIISYTSTTVCGTVNDTMLVTVNPAPNAGTIIGLSSVCEGASITLSDSIAGGTWATGIGTTTVSGGVVTGISPGSSTIYYSISNSCGSASATFAITVNPLPDAGSITGTDSVCAGETVTLGSSATGGTWTSTDAALATVSPAGQVTGVLSGTTNILYITSNSCGTDTATFALRVRSIASCETAIRNTAKANTGLLLFPNPNDGAFTLSGEWMNGSDKDLSVEIVNMLGQIVYKSILANQNGIISEAIRTDHRLVNGIYLLNVYGDSGYQTLRFVVKD